MKPEFRVIINIYIRVIKTRLDDPEIRMLFDSRRR